MTKVDIFSGFLGSGKTTLIKKLVAESFKGEKVVLIENEFGEINIDSGFLKDSGILINEMSSGCICCTLVGDFGDSLRQVLAQYEPDRILIEPSGVGKLSDVIRAVQGVAEDMPLELNSFVAVADAKKCKMYAKNFGEFYIDQIAHAKTIILSRTQDISEEKLQADIELIRKHNPDARIITTPWDELTGDVILEAMEEDKSFAEQLLEDLANEPLHEHHHHDHDDDDDEHEHHHHHHHDHDDDDDEHEHHHHHHHDHDHDDDDEHEHHHHHHDHDHHHHHDHDHCHHDHDADEIFSTWGTETPRKYSEAEIREALEELDLGMCGTVLRAKGIVQAEDGEWIHFDFVPGETQIRRGPASYTGQLCVIGADLKEDEIAELFHAE
ncbi:MAG: GTP-binding protein [Firmicutes bacterium]|nr:GTP-binding protein [Bacillota bacterium]